MPHLEPTYLRYIYDGLVKGSIHPENAAELPEGLIGMYEEAFDERTSFLERQKTLQRFAIWALLKKEVSAGFVAEVLGESEEEILDFISNYSAWFNSPESGKYQLYHERLKVYLLQKLSEGEIHGLHEKLISRLKQGIEEQKADEFEWYGLQFMSNHLKTMAQITLNSLPFINFVHSENIWKRQIELSNSYSWSRNGLILGIELGIKNDPHSLIDYGLDLVELFYRQNNEIETIFDLLDRNKVQEALERIETAGGYTQEVRQRQFILYMSCLYHLTNEPKESHYLKATIETILKHFDQNVSSDCSELNWNDFYPGFLIYKITYHLYKIGLDYSVILKRTEECDFSFIERSDQFGIKEYDFLFKFEDFIRYGSMNKSRILNSKALYYAKKKDLNGALKTTALILNQATKSKSLLKIIQILQIKGEKRVKLLKRSLTCALKEKNQKQKSFALADFIANLQQHSDTELYDNAITKAKKSYLKINNLEEMIAAMLSIAMATLKFGRKDHYEAILNEIFEFKEQITDSDELIAVLCELSHAYYKSGDTKNSDMILIEILSICQSTPSGYTKSFRLQKLAHQYALQNKFDLSIQLISSIEDPYILNEALSMAVLELVRTGDFDRAIEITETISWEEHKVIAYLSIASEAAVQRSLIYAHRIMLKSIILSRGITDFNEKFMALESVGIDFVNQENNERAIAISEQINDRERKGTILREMALKLVHSGAFHESIELISFILGSDFIHTDVKYKLVDSLRKLKAIQNNKFQFVMLETLRYTIKKHSNTVTDTLEKQYGIKLICAIAGTLNGSEKFTALNSAVQIAKKIKSKNDRISAMIEILSHLDKDGKMELFEKTMEIASHIKNVSEKTESLCSIVCKYRFIDKKQCNTILNAQLLEIRRETNRKIRDKNLRLIAVNFAKLKKYGKTFELLEEIVSDEEKSTGMNEIAIELLKNGKTEDAYYLLQKIPYHSEQLNCLYDMAASFIASYGLHRAIQECKNFSSHQLAHSWIAAIAENVKPSETIFPDLIPLLFFNKDDSQLLNRILQLYAINQLFFTDLPQEKLDRYNRTLNLQWAIDIKNQLPN